MEQRSSSFVSESLTFQLLWDFFEQTIQNVQVTVSIVVAKKVISLPEWRLLSIVAAVSWGHSDSSFYQHWRLCDQSEIETIIKQRMSSYLPTVQLRMSRDHRTSSPCPNLIFHGVFLYSRYSLQSKLRRRTSRIKTCRSKRMGGSPSAS